NRGEICVHRFESPNLLGYGVDRGHPAVHRRADRDEQFVEGIDRFCGLAVDGLSDFADAYFGIECHFDGGAGGNAHGHGDGRARDGLSSEVFLCWLRLSLLCVLICGWTYLQGLAQTPSGCHKQQTRCAPRPLQRNSTHSMLLNEEILCWLRRGRKPKKPAGTSDRD